NGKFHRRETRANHIQFPGRLYGKVDHPTLDKRTAIVDANIHVTAVFLIGDSDESIKRKGAMSCGEVLIGIENLATGCGTTGIWLGIVGGQALKFGCRSCRSGSSGRRRRVTRRRNVLPASTDENQNQQEWSKSMHPKVIP